MCPEPGRPVRFCVRVCVYRCVCVYNGSSGPIVCACVRVCTQVCVRVGVPQDVRSGQRVRDNKGEGLQRVRVQLTPHR